MTDHKRPFNIARLDHVVLRTNQIDALLEFYELFGATVERDLREKMGMLQLRLGDSMMDIVDANGVIGKMSDPGAGPSVDGRNMDHFAVRVDPYDESDILAFCADHSVDAQALPMPLLGADGYGPAIYARDPDGNRLELKGPPNEDQTPPVMPNIDS